MVKTISNGSSAARACGLLAEEEQHLAGFDLMGDPGHANFGAAIGDQDKGIIGSCVFA